MNNDMYELENDTIASIEKEKEQKWIKKDQDEDLCLAFGIGGGEHDL